MESDKRKWHFSKEIPVAELMTVFLAIFAGGVAYSNITNRMDTLAANQVQLSIRQDKTDNKVDDLRDTFQNGTVPSALNARRIDELERMFAALQSAQAQHLATLIQVTARVTENERKLSLESIRSRARVER